MSTLERRVSITPAWDKRDPDPKKNYGINPCELLMTIVGPAGAITFSMFTQWFLPGVHQENLSKNFHPRPTGIGVSTHRPEPTGPDDRPHDTCEFLGGRPCYGDISYGAGDNLLSILLREGSDGVWRELEERYRQEFGGSA